MRVPVQLVTGVHEEATAATTAALLLDLLDAVAVHHHIDVERSVLRRTVSDLTGVLEREEVDLAHACVSCALREDVLPTLERLADLGRWRHVVAQLPLGAEADQVCRVLAADTRAAARLRVAAVVAALAGPGVEDVLLGGDLLVDHDAHCADDDRRGLGETACALVEHADVVVTQGDAGEVGRELLATLARPDVDVVAGPEHLDGAALGAGRHDHARTRAWTSVVRTGRLPRVRLEHTWRFDLATALPFHPDRLRRDLADLGGGRHRSRGCFWLPTRPGRTLAWGGAGGQLSVGDHGPWAGREPVTRLVVVGVGEPPAAVADAFRRVVLGPEEAATRSWRVDEDGFEPWLGPIEPAR